MDTTADKIYVTHLNIRPSIFLVLFQLLFVNILASFSIIAGYLLILNYEPTISLFLKSFAGLIVLAAVSMFQFYLGIYAILQWINEYYELTPKELVHKKGVIWRKVEKYSMEHIKYVKVNQDILGRLFNYGSLSFYDSRRTKYLDLYFIHSPMRYLEIFENINSDLDELEDVIRGSEGLNYS